MPSVPAWQVALPLPLPQLFDYAPPDDDGASACDPVGARVRVPFGNRELVGVVAGTASVDAADTLRQVATMTGGRFFRARDTGELAGIYAELDRLEPVDVAAAPVRPRIERYPWPLGAALALAILAWPLQRATRAGRGP